MTNLASGTGNATGVSSASGSSNTVISDARLLELIFLDRLERVAALSIDAIASDCPERRMIIHLLAEGLVNDASHVEFPPNARITGDAAIKRYLEMIAEIVGVNGDAYRLSGGADEVVILLPRTSLGAATAITRGLLAALAREHVDGISLRAAAGIVIADDPGESVDALKKRADEVQTRAKRSSRLEEARPSFLAWGTSDPVRFP